MTFDKLDVVKSELRKLADEVQTLTDEVQTFRATPAIGPHQLNTIGPSPDGDMYYTVTYPPGETTVLSVQPDGTIETRPAGTCGPFELTLQKFDRLIYAPKGPAGAVFLLPFTDVIPNE